MKEKERKIKQKSHIALHTSHNSGITLVALIITIIVLLILAVVAIRAVQGDGIIGHAKNASNETKIAQEKEQIQLALNEWQIQKNYKKPSDENFHSFMDSKLKNIADVANAEENNNDGPQIVTMNDTGNRYKVEENGTITTLKKLSLLEKYVLGENGTGRPLNDIFTFSNGFKNRDETIKDANTSITPLGYKDDGIVIKYENKAYIINITGGTLFEANTITKELYEIYEPQGNEGKTVKYDGDGDGLPEEWIVITDRDGKLEIVSNSTKGELELGKGDTEVTVTEDLDGDGITGNDGDIAIASYNNVVKRINDYCKTFVTATNNGGVRSIGGNLDKDERYNSTNFNNWFKGTAKIKAEYLNNYEEDFAKMCYLEISNTSAAYWVPSRYVDENDTEISFQVVHGGTNIYTTLGIFVLKNTGEIKFGSQTNKLPVRPVVINPDLSAIEYID